MLFASVIDLVCRVVLFFGKGIKALTEGMFGAFFMEWLALPLLVVGIASIVYLTAKFRKK